MAPNIHIPCQNGNKKDDYLMIQKKLNNYYSYFLLLFKQIN